MPPRKGRTQSEANLQLAVPLKRRRGHPNLQSPVEQLQEPNASSLVQRDGNTPGSGRTSALKNHGKEVGIINDIAATTISNGSVMLVDSSIHLDSGVDAASTTAPLSEDTTGNDGSDQTDSSIVATKASDNDVDVGGNTPMLSKYTTANDDNAQTGNSNVAAEFRATPSMQSTSVGSGPIVQSKVVQVNLATLAKGGKLTFSEAIAKLTGKPTESPPKPVRTTSPAVYLEDVDRRIVKSLPVQCMVTDESLQDQLLMDDYTGLPPLAQGQLKSWSDRIGPGTTRFSGWFNVCPMLEFTRAINAIQFVTNGRYVNPSRVNPTMLSTRHSSSNQTRFVAEVKLQDEWVTAVFVTPIRVLQSRLIAGIRGQKLVSGAAHGQEWERMAAVFCMIIGEPVVQAQVVGSDLSFSTKTATTRFSAYNNGPSTSNVAMVNSSPSPASITVSGAASASKRQMAIDGTSSAFVRTVLDASDIVPVFDARDHANEFEFSDSSLSQLENSLPLFGGEIPEGSLATVAYTATYWYKEFEKAADRACNLSVNLQWVIVLGTPE